MVDDIDLPVWTVRPNWRNGILERLSWLTDVLASTLGPEQRRALRLSPRRQFEMTFNPFKQARSYFDLFLHRLGSNEFMVPLFHDRGRLTAGIAGGATAVPIDTTYREFEAGGLAVIIGDDPFTFNKLEVTAVAADELTVALGGVTQAWGEGVAVYPLRRSRLSQESHFAALTSRVGESTLEFELNQANDIADEGVWADLYADDPILLTPPNRREAIDLDYIRNSLLLDNDHGLRHLLDDADRAFNVQVHNMMMRGRAEHWAFRQLLYRLRGQQSSIWIPTFNEDIVLSRDRLAADALLDVQKIGYGYVGGEISGRRHLLINGIVGAEITDTQADPSNSEERLTLAAALGTDLPAGTTASFMDIARLNSDTVEIMHHTDTDGTAESNLSFRTFLNEREENPVVSYPIPGVSERTVPCGEVEPFFEIVGGYSRAQPTGSNAEFEINLPVVPEEGDLLIAVGWEFNNNIIGVRAGWTLEPAVTADVVGVFDRCLRVAYKYCGPDETAFQQPFTVGDDNDHTGLTILHCRTDAAWGDVFVGATHNDNVWTLTRNITENDSIVMASCFYSRAAPGAFLDEGDITNAGWTIIDGDGDYMVSTLLAYQLRDAGNVTLNYLVLPNGGTLSSAAICLVQLRRIGPP
jgi:hypothetical protein